VRSLTDDEAAVATIARRCKEVEIRARNVDHILTGRLLPEVSHAFLKRMAEGQSIGSILVGVDGGAIRLHDHVTRGQSLSTSNTAMPRSPATARVMPSGANAIA
jgi:hypothetical protein